MHQLPCRHHHSQKTIHAQDQKRLGPHTEEVGYVENLDAESLGFFPPVIKSSELSMPWLLAFSSLPVVA